MTSTPSMSRTPRSRHRPTSPSLVVLAKSAANDEGAPGSRADESANGHSQMLGEILREMVRSEVRAEVARVVPAAPVQPAYLSVAEYAIARSISISTVRNAIRGGRLPAIKIGAAIRVRADVEIGEPVVVRASCRPVSPTARGAEIFEARRKRSPPSSEGNRAA